MKIIDFAFLPTKIWVNCQVLGPCSDKAKVVKVPEKREKKIVSKN